MTSILTPRWHIQLYNYKRRLCGSHGQKIWENKINPVFDAKDCNFLVLYCSYHVAICLLNDKNKVQYCKPTETFGLIIQKTSASQRKMLSLFQSSRELM